MTQDFSAMPSSEFGATELSVLLKVLEGTAVATGDEFFQLLVQKLSEATGVANAFIAVFANDKTRVRTLAYWSEGQLIDNDEWDLEGSPCKDVVNGELCHHPFGLGKKFPIWDYLESYLGVPLKDVDGEVLGHVAIYSKTEMPAKTQLFYIFQIFAVRAASELARIRTTDKLRQMEERFRDLFDEAPIDYVHERLDSNFIRANKTAMRVLGITPEEVATTFGKTFAPDTPDAQCRMREAFEAIGKGADTSGVVLEMRRKDNAKPFWIQWWSRPDPSGTFTRTMFLDITDKVLMEQEQARLQEQNQYLQEELKSAHNYGEIVGVSIKIKSLLNNVSRVATTNASVLIQGESGVTSRAIWY